MTDYQRLNQWADRNKQWDRVWATKEQMRRTSLDKGFYWGEKCRERRDRLINTQKIEVLLLNRTTNFNHGQIKRSAREISKGDQHLSYQVLHKRLWLTIVSAALLLFLLVDIQLVKGHIHFIVFNAEFVLLRCHNKSSWHTSNIWERIWEINRVLNIAALDQLYIFKYFTTWQNKNKTLEYSIAPRVLFMEH